MKPDRGSHYFDMRRDGYVVWDGHAARFVSRETLDREFPNMGGIPSGRKSDRLAAALLDIVERDDMTRKVINIEIVADLETDQFDAVLEAARDAARTVLTMAMVVSTKNKRPTAKVVSSDFLNGAVEWDIDAEETT